MGFKIQDCLRDFCVRKSLALPESIWALKEFENR